MKTTTSKAVRSLYGLCFVMLVYACTRQDAEPLSPFTFETLRDLKLTNAKVSAPAPVVVTPSTITSSTRWNEVRTGIAGIPAGGGIPGAVSTAASDMNNALSAAGITATALSASFNAQVVSTLTSSGNLPAGLQSTINTLVANPALQVYWTAFTYPQVNGQQITPTTTTIPGPGTVAITGPIAIREINYSGNDQCFKNANDTFDRTINGLEAQRAGQVATADASYNSAKAAAEAEAPTCLSGNLSKYSTLISTARQDLTSTLSSLNAARLLIGDGTFNALTALAYVQYAQTIQVYFKLQLADINTCTITSSAKIASAKFARDTDINAINETFNSTIKTAQALVLQLYDSCHNQGSGSNG